MARCQNCGADVIGKGASHGRFCTSRCYHTAWMRERRQADLTAYREEMRERRKDPAFMERQRESNRRSRERRREEVAAQSREWSKRNRHKADAERRARAAVKRGELTREPCLFCDSEQVQAHHHDYAQPLAVTWLCPTHHGLVHRKVA